MTVGLPGVRLPVSDPGMVLVGQEQARRLARRLGLAEPVAEAAATVAAELAGNAQRHAVGGQLLLLPDARDAGLDVVVTDRGPGRADLDRWFTDGWSTIGSLGSGLGAVRRAATSVDGVSEPGTGTVLAARVGAASSTPQVAAVGLPCPGEPVNGDSWAWTAVPGGLLAVLADGLGHGPVAASASATAVADLPALAGSSPRQVVEAVHARLRRSRGAAVTAVRLAVAPDGPARVTACGVGNVAVAVVAVDGTARRLPLSHGTAGVAVRRPLQVEAPLPAGSRVVLHTDGLTGRWELARRRALLAASPRVLAAALLRDFERGSDDTGVLVIDTDAAAAYGATGREG